MDGYRSDVPFAPPGRLRYAFVDMNSFFASVEQQDDPSLRGSPVGVAAVNVPTTACIATSYEAKRLGIRTGTSVAEARAICPSVVILEARPKRYVEVHHGLVRAVGSCLPVGAVESIDEMWGRLDPAACSRDDAVELAVRIKAALADEVGDHITCTVGVAPNRFLAKIATEMRKPDGLVILEHHDLPDALFGLELVELPGIARAMLARLNRYYIETVRDLCRADVGTLRSVWGGVVGERWHRWLRGEDLVLPNGVRRSVGHSHVLSPHHRSDDKAQAVFVRLIHKAAARLRYLGLGARQVEFYVSYAWREEGWRARVRLDLTQSTSAVVREFRAVWPQRPRGTPTQLAVTFLRVRPWRGSTPTLPFDRRNDPSLDRLLDEANDRFGPKTLLWGGMLGVEDSAPTRISFTHVPVLENAYEG